LAEAREFDIRDMVLEASGMTFNKTHRHCHSRDIDKKRHVILVAVFLCVVGCGEVADERAAVHDSGGMNKNEFIVGDMKVTRFSDGFSLKMDSCWQERALKMQNSPIKRLVINVGCNLHSLCLFKEYLNLEELHIKGAQVSDLSPLALLPLRVLVLRDSLVQDLSPLKNMRSLEVLDLSGSPVVSLLPVQKLSLRVLSISDTKVSDLSPVRNMPLERLEIGGTAVTDFGPLAGLPLRTVYYSVKSHDEGLDIFGRMQTLTNVNGCKIGNGCLVNNRFLVNRVSGALECVGITQSGMNVVWEYYGRRLLRDELLSEIMRSSVRGSQEYMIYANTTNATLGAVDKTMRILRSAGVERIMIWDTLEGRLFDTDESSADQLSHSAGEFVRLGWNGAERSWVYYGKHLSFHEFREEVARKCESGKRSYLIYGYDPDLPASILSETCDILREAGVVDVNLWNFFVGRLSVSSGS